MGDVLAFTPGNANRMAEEACAGLTFAGTADDIQVASAGQAGVFNMGGSALAKCLSILEVIQ